MYKIIRKPLLLLLFCFIIVSAAKAQLTISGQVRTRTEYRNGQGTPQIADTSSAVFTSQRTRLNIGYSGYRFKLYTSLQDVRVWGQDASTINRTTIDAYDGFMLHEAWGEISLVDTGKVVKNFSVKIGRQELVYDDVRLLGNLDWLQQARRHDAILFKFEHKGWMIHLGGAFNQNEERKSNSSYNAGVPTGAPASYRVSTNGMANNYKSMQFLYVGKKLVFGNASLLLFKDDFSRYHADPNDATKTIWESGYRSRYTMGGNLFGTALRKISFGASAFYQSGHYRDGSKLDEGLLSLSASYALTRKFSFGPGVDYTSGNANGKTGKRFDPLYGTPHKFWGYMDYFYVADGFGSNGLYDYYLKGKFKAKDNLTLTLDAHRFVLPSAVKGGDGKLISQKAIGTELDFVFNYAMTKAITIEGGYCRMFTTDTMFSKQVKGTAKLTTATAGKSSDWAYLMISIKPEFTFKP